MITEVNTPNGRVKVSHPDGATESEIIAYAKANYSEPSKKPQPKSLKERRADIGGGTLQFGPFDTGVETPQWLDEGLAGMGRRMSQIGTLGLHKGDPAANELLDDSIPAAVGGAVTDVGALALGGAGLKAAGAIPKLGGVIAKGGGALTKPQSLLSGMGAAGVYGAATSPERGEAGLAAALGQGVGYGVPKIAGKVVAPKVKSMAKELIKKGGTVTPGEAFGGSLQVAEDAATSVPLMGSMVKGAKKRSLEGYGKGVINDALEGIGARLDDSVVMGRGAISSADEIISKGYDDALSGMNVKVDQQFSDDLAGLLKMAEKMPPKERNTFQNIIADKVLPVFDNPNQMALGQTYKETDSALRTMYKKLQKSQDFYQSQLGDAVRSVHTSLINMGKRNNPASGKALDALDVAYAKMFKVSEASKYAGAVDGVFTPANMLAVTRKGTSTKAFGGGHGYDQLSTEAAKDTLAQTVPDSGTVGRALTNAAILGGTYTISPATVAGIAGGAGLYTKPGQKALAALLMKRPEGAMAARTALERLAPYLGVTGAAGGMQVKQ